METVMEPQPPQPPLSPRRNHYALIPPAGQGVPGAWWRNKPNSLLEPGTKVFAFIVAAVGSDHVKKTPTN